MSESIIINKVNTTSNSLFLSRNNEIDTTGRINEDNTPFINNINSLSNNKSDLAKDGYIEILLYPSNDYDRINHLISRIFDAI